MAIGGGSAPLLARNGTGDQVGTQDRAVLGQAIPSRASSITGKTLAAGTFAQRIKSSSNPVAFNLSAL